MTNKEAIKYLKQLYPNGGHCWLDEQRIEAIGMAVKALQEEPTGNPFGSTHAKFRTAVESLGISQEEHDRIVDECIYGKEPELVDADDLPKEEPVSEDLELTWEDIYSILYAEREVLREFGYEEHSNEEVCKEVLKRFKDLKNGTTKR